jgi:hypothetical protein
LSDTPFQQFRVAVGLESKNGDLLTLAEKEFDAFITVDRKLSGQQDLARFKIAVLLIRAKTLFGSWNAALLAAGIDPRCQKLVAMSGSMGAKP